MPLLTPHIFMETIPSTMSFLYAVGGRIENNIPNIQNSTIYDATSEIEWSTINTHINPKYSWDVYTSSIKNIRVYKGITSTLRVLSHINGQLEHGDEICDDPDNSEEWSTITHYMTPKLSWGEYTSTIHHLMSTATAVKYDEYFNFLPSRIIADLEKCDKIFSIENENTITNISEFVVYKRNLLKFLSTPCVLLKDYTSTVQLYPRIPKHYKSQK